MTATVNINRLIVSTPDVCGGRPRIDGSRITVQYVINEIQAGVTPEEILEDKPHLTLAGIYTALAYYYDNKESLDAEFALYAQECEQLLAEYRIGN
ncbi:MAG: DUF433 domain-containing protein [Waterburya sp.]